MNPATITPIIIAGIIQPAILLETFFAGISEIVELNYPPEYIDSEYSLDLYFFEKNVKKYKNSFSTENI